jgi:hypothetical protein
MLVKAIAPPVLMHDRDRSADGRKPSGSAFHSSSILRPRCAAALGRYCFRVRSSRIASS